MRACEAELLDDIIQVQFRCKAESCAIERQVILPRRFASECGCAAIHSF